MGVHRLRSTVQVNALRELWQVLIKYKYMSEVPDYKYLKDVEG